MKLTVSLPSTAGDSGDEMSRGARGSVNALAWCWRSMRGFLLCSKSRGVYSRPHTSASLHASPRRSLPCGLQHKVCINIVTKVRVTWKGLLCLHSEPAPPRGHQPSLCGKCSQLLPVFAFHPDFCARDTGCHRQATSFLSAPVIYWLA